MAEEALNASELFTLLYPTRSESEVARNDMRRSSLPPATSKLAISGHNYETDAWVDNG